MIFLKKIEAFGFKSFADKTVIDFSALLTVVVGPNGSGKSNVVDAIRWVLGEQSAKSLRGDRMYDVIFGGSKSRKVMNIAEVTLTLNNSSKILPIAFEEVQVTRRLYRSGESEYLLNKEKVRLQDIVTLFLDSGIGKESFSIIGQGKIDEILNSKPEMRRGIFEEASGVVKYKYKKEQTLKKLTKTDENIVRLKDIESEVNKQISPLKSQVNKAKKYKELQSELRGIEVSIIVNDVEKSVKTNEQLAMDSSQLTLQINEKTEEITKIQNELFKQESLVMKDQQKLDQLQSQIIEQTKLVEKYVGQQAVIKAKVENYNAQFSQLNSQEISLNGFFEQLTTGSFDEQSSDDFEVKIKDVRQRLVDITNTNDLLETQLAEVLKNVKEYQYQNVQIDATIRTLNQQIDSNINYFPGVKAVLNNRSILHGVCDAVGNVVTTPVKFEVAIDVALQTSSQHIIVNTPKDGKNAIEFLNREKKGRATFLPLSEIHGKNVSSEIKELVKSRKGYLGVAVDLVTYDKKYSKIISNILGSTLIVDTLENAMNLSHLCKNKVKIITLNGEILSPGGAMTGGNINHNKVSIIHLKNEVESLNTKKISIEQKVKKLESNQSEVENLILENNKSSSKNTQLLVQLEEQVKQYIDSREQRVANEQYLEVEFQKINKHRDQLTIQQENDRQTIVEIEKTLKIERNVLKTLEDELPLLQQILISKTSGINDLKDKVKESEATTRVLEKNLHGLEIDLNRSEVLIENHYEKLNQVYNITLDEARTVAYEIEENTIQKYRDKVLMLRQKIENLGVVNVGSIDELERLTERSNFLFEQITDLSNAKSALLATVFEMDTEMNHRFFETFNAIRTEFTNVFKQLFGGGDAKLILTDPKDILHTGIEIEAQPPGKKLGHLTLLSGGERALTAIALLFSILKVKPIPFCVLDEVEAALDDANVDRYAKYLHTFSKSTQFIVISHRKGTMEQADILYGVTMQESGVSRLVSVKLD